MNKLTLILAGATCISALAFVACDKKVGKLPEENNGQGTTTSPTPPPVGFCDTITYNKHIKKIIDANCVSCHGPSVQQAGVTLTTYAEVKNKADAGRIKARVIDGQGGFMPQGGELTAAEKNLIVCWLNNGKKEN